MACQLIDVTLTSQTPTTWGKLMRVIPTIAAALALTTLAACNKTDSANEQAADNIEAVAENQADIVETNTENAADALEAAGENAAGAIREQAEEKADAVRNEKDADGKGADADGNSAN
jgi:signal recognition particle receptor subunit beta